MKKFLIVIIFLGGLATLYATGTKLNHNQLPADAPQVATTVLDSAQIVNLSTTPVLLVDTPGGGKIIMPYMATMQIAHTNYTGTGALTLVWRSPGGTYTSAVCTSATSPFGFYGTPGAVALMMPYTTSAQIFKQDSIINCPLSIKSGGAFGGAGDPVTVKVYYNIITP